MTKNDKTCSLCGKKGIRIRRITESFGRGKDEYLIRNIPTILCPHCRESYLTAATLHEIERIKANHRTLAVIRTFPVADFAKSGRRRTA